MEENRGTKIKWRENEQCVERRGRKRERRRERAHKTDEKVNERT